MGPFRDQRCWIDLVRGDNDLFVTWPVLFVSWVPAFAGMTDWCEGDDIGLGIAIFSASLWLFCSLDSRLRGNDGLVVRWRYQDRGGRLDVSLTIS